MVSTCFGQYLLTLSMIPVAVIVPHLLQMGVIPSASVGITPLPILLAVGLIVDSSPGTVGVCTYPILLTGQKGFPIPCVMLAFRNTLSGQDRFPMLSIVSTASLPHCFYGTSRSRSGSLSGFQSAGGRFDLWIPAEYDA